MSRGHGFFAGTFDEWGYAKRKSKIARGGGGPYDDP